MRDCVIAAAAIDDAPSPLACICAVTFLTAGAAQAGNSSPVLMLSNSCPSWYLTVAFSLTVPCAAAAIASLDMAPCMSPILDSCDNVP